MLNMFGNPCPNFFGEGVCNDEGYFLTEVIKFYWLMLLLYPGELYRFMGASTWLSLVLKRFYTGVCEMILKI
jgi:hypothetical protein